MDGSGNMCAALVVVFALDQQFGSTTEGLFTSWQTLLHLAMEDLPSEIAHWHQPSTSFDFCAMSVFAVAKLASGQQTPTTVPQLPVGI